MPPSGAGGVPAPRPIAPCSCGAGAPRAPSRRTRSDNKPAPLPRWPMSTARWLQARVEPPAPGAAQPLCPRPRAARSGAASGLEGHGRAQAAKQPSTTGRSATATREQPPPRPPRLPGNDQRRPRRGRLTARRVSGIYKLSFTPRKTVGITPSLIKIQPTLVLARLGNARCDGENKRV